MPVRSELHHPGPEFASLFAVREIADDVGVAQIDADDPISSGLEDAPGRAADA
jgi:hypothetical protein